MVSEDNTGDARRVVPLLTAKDRQRIEQVLGLIEQRARWFGRKYAGFIDPEELETMGKIGAMEVVRQYDEARDASFEAYAIARIDGRMLKLVRAETRAKRMDQAMRRAGAVVRAHHRGELDFFNETTETLQGRLQQLSEEVAAAALVGALGEARDEEEIARGEYAGAMRMLAEAIAALTHDEAQVIMAIFVDGMAMRDIEAELGIPYITVRRRVERAMTKLRKALQKRGARRRIESRDVPGVSPVLWSARGEKR